MRDPPSGRGPEQGPDGFLVATEACGGGTPDLGFLLEVLGYIRGVGVGNKSGGSRRWPRGRGRAQGVGHTPTLVVSSGLIWPISGTLWASSGPEMISVNFQVNWTTFDFPFLRYSKTRKKQKLALGSRLIG